jgi:transposase-like protein
MNTENNNAPRKHKRSAVELLLQGGKSVEAIAAELGINTQSLKQWKRKLSSLPGNRPGAALAEPARRGEPPSQARAAIRLPPARHSKNAGHPVSLRERFARMKAMHAHYSIGELCELFRSILERIGRLRLANAMSG